ncbi:hypothetical protein GCM10029963_49020 [Micromonospora andamanensis]
MLAKGPFTAVTLVRVGSGPRWYGLSAADADPAVTVRVNIPTAAAIPAVASLNSLPRTRGRLGQQGFPPTAGVVYGWSHCRYLLVVGV